MSETELCKKIRKFGVPTLRKCLFRVNNRSIQLIQSMSVSPPNADFVVRQFVKGRKAEEIWHSD